MRVEVTPRPGEAVEELTFAATDGGVVLRWGGLEVPVRISAGSE